MFCPSCGSEERRPNQFCRACGMDLRNVRWAIEKPDQITASAVSARNEVGRAIAAKIQEIDSAGELKIVAENVLPQIEKFLESPEQKRLRFVRDGVITSAAGAGATIMFYLFSLTNKDVFFLMGIGIAALLIGLGIVLNGLLFTVPRKRIENGLAQTEKHNELEQSLANIEPTTGKLARTNRTFASITEHTTHQLNDQQN